MLPIIVNTKYIREHYDLEKERQTTIEKIPYGTMNLSWIKNLSKDGLRQELDYVLKDFPDNVFFDFEFGEWDNPDEIQIYTKELRPETDDEVIKRLIRIEREKRKKEREIEKAKKILEENNYTIKEKNGEVSK